MVEVRLTGPRGDNPLGFLATLGVAASLETGRIPCQIRWDGLSPVLCWEPSTAFSRTSGEVCAREQCPVGHRSLSADEEHLILALYTLLHRNPPSEEAQDELTAAERQLREWRTKVKKKEAELKKLRLPRNERKQVEQLELNPLELKRDQAQKHYLACLAKSTVDPALSLGDNLTAKNQLWGDFLDRLVMIGMQLKDRRLLDLLACYGMGDANEPEGDMQSTPWALVRGAGHQHFLGSVRELMQRCLPCHFAKAAFGPWVGSDEQFSLRLDPGEDRRYALMSADPTAAGNRPKTLWGANRLAFEALQFFPVYPSHPVGVIGWKSSERGDWDDGSEVRWPLWNKPLSPAVIRSLMRLPDLWQDPPAASLGRRGDASLSARARLQCRGVFAVFRSKRIRDDKRYNLTPGTACWMILPRPE
jgi:hypothetical protein